MQSGRAISYERLEEESLRRALGFARSVLWEISVRGGVYGASRRPVHAGPTSRRLILPEEEDVRPHMVQLLADWGQPDYELGELLTVGAVQCTGAEIVLHASLCVQGDRGFIHPRMPGVSPNTVRVIASVHRSNKGVIGAIERPVEATKHRS